MDHPTLELNNPKVFRPKTDTTKRASSPATAEHFSIGRQYHTIIRTALIPSRRALTSQVDRSGYTRFNLHSGFDRTSPTRHNARPFPLDLPLSTPDPPRSESPGQSEDVVTANASVAIEQEREKLKEESLLKR